MSKPLPTRTLPAKPDLDQLKRQAKDLVKAFRDGDLAAAKEVGTRYNLADAETFALHHAQLVFARGYGFDSWPKLKAFVDGVNVGRLADAVRLGDVELVESMLQTRSELVNMERSEGDEHRPLHYAVLNRDPKMVRTLMRHGANAHHGIHPRREATTAMTIARERAYDVIVAWFERFSTGTPIRTGKAPAAARRSTMPWEAAGTDR